MIKGLNILAEKLEEYMDLENRVIVHTENWEMPDDDNIYILLNILSSQVSEYENKITEVEYKDIESENIVKEIVSKDFFTVKYTVSAEMIGKPQADMNNDPRMRHLEMGMALKSLGKQIVEENNISIQILEECKNLSAIESVYTLCKFRQDFSVTEQIEKDSDMDYFAEPGKTNFLNLETKQEEVNND